MAVPENRPNRKRGKVDRELLDSFSEADIERFQGEDGEDQNALGPVTVIANGPNVSEIRNKFGLSQEEFASKFGLSLRTLQEWEQKRRAPDGPAKVLLRVIEFDPEAVARATRR